ncbi:MAG: Permease of the drug/metabolite transporter (DMT) superfamily [Chloroflexi bacterium]|jgi:drug/metabolite transporter (DMT)-like permease|nr:MAG: Permease of the drug/metabolite transporter (DMT) superfamily [Chloroflexota bacterium]
MDKYLTRENYGFLLGLIGVVVFSSTLPITRHLAQIGFTSLEIGFGRGFIAGLASLLILLFKGHLKFEKLPHRSDFTKLVITAIGVVFGFPIFTAVAMQTIPAGNGGIVLAAVPLSTAIFAGFLSEEKPSVRFWIIAILGFISVIIFRLLTTDSSIWDMGLGDLALFLCVLLGGMGYAQGGILGKRMSGWRVICWSLVISLPVVVPLTLINFDFTHLVQITGDSPKSIILFTFLCLFNNLIGFFFFYEGMGMGGVARVSQIDLFRPFLTFFFSVVFLAEKMSVISIFFLLLIIVIVYSSKRSKII